MDIRDYIPSGLALVTPSDTAELVSVVGLRVVNQNASWVSIRIMEKDGSDATLFFPPGLTVEPIEARRVYATSPDVSANVFIHAYVRGL